MAKRKHFRLCVDVNRGRTYYLYSIMRFHKWGLDFVHDIDCTFRPFARH